MFECTLSSLGFCVQKIEKNPLLQSKGVNITPAIVFIKLYHYKLSYLIVCRHKYVQWYMLKRKEQ